MITTPISSTPQSGRKRPVVMTTDDELPAIPVPSDQESGQTSFLTPEPAAKRRPHRTVSGELTGPNSEDRDHDRSSGSANGSKGDDEIEDEHDPNSVFTPGTNTAHLLLHLRRKWVVGNGASLGGNGKPSYSSPTLKADGALISDSPATADVTDDNDTPVRATDHPIADHRITVGAPSPSPVATSLFTKKEEQPRTATSGTPVRVSTGAGRSREPARANVSSSSTGTSRRKMGTAQKPMGRAGETTPRSKAAGVGTSSGQTKSPVGVLSEGRTGSAGGSSGSSGTIKHRTATRERPNGRRGCTSAPGGGKSIKSHGNGNPTLGRGRGSMGGGALESTTTATCQQPLRPVQSATSVSLTGAAFPCGVLGIAFPVGGKGGTPTPEGCSCKKSLCLKLYCQCFAAQMLCHQSCKCENCYNNVSHSVERQTAIRELLCRSPHAFDAKFCKAQVDTADGGSGSGSVVVHNTGCGCSKSACLKRYCECFNGGIACSDKCRCKDCRNTVDAVRSRGGRSRSGVAAAAVAAIAQGPQPGQQHQHQHVAASPASRASVGVTTYIAGHSESRGRRDDGNEAQFNVDREGRRVCGGENVLNGAHGRDSEDAAEGKEGYRSSALHVASSSGSTGRSPLEALPGFGSGLRDGSNQGARV